jgi:hypothetical protein
MSDDPNLVSQAEAVLLNEVYQPIFFEKLASHGIVPSSDDEARTLLQMGGQLRTLHDTNVEKAAAVDPLIKTASDRLNAFCGNQYPDTLDVSDQRAAAVADSLLTNEDFAKIAAICGRSRFEQIAAALA